jgi:hypothetical protein
MKKKSRGRLERVVEAWNPAVYGSKEWNITLLPERIKLLVLSLHWVLQIGIMNNLTFQSSRAKML